MAYTSPSTRAAGYVVGATQWNELVNNDKWGWETNATGRPYCRVYKSANQLTAHATYSPVTWDVNHLDPTGCHSTAVNPTRLIAPVSGWYRTVSNVRWDINLNNSRHAQILENGAGFVNGEITANAVAIFESGLIVTHYSRLLAGQYTEVAALQTSGGNLNIMGGGKSWAWFEWIGTY